MRTLKWSLSTKTNTKARITLIAIFCNRRIKFSALKSIELIIKLIINNKSTNYIRTN